MSASWLQNRQTNSSLCQGFTLLEVLTVVFIIGIAASFVAPNLTALFDSIFTSNQRDSFIRNVNTLPYKAFTTNQDLVLIDGEHKNIDRDESSEKKYADSMELGIPGPYRASGLRLIDLEVPEGWTVRVQQPILYRASGFCGGGRLSVTSGRMTTNYDLAPPHCQISLEDQ